MIEVTLPHKATSERSAGSVRALGDHLQLDPSGIDVDTIALMTQACRSQNLRQEPAGPPPPGAQLGRFRDPFVVLLCSVTRLTPILMTTTATVFGHLPLVFVTGAVARNSIGIMLVSGTAIGTVFTLFILPAVYMLFAADHRPQTAAEPALQPAE